MVDFGIALTFADALRVAWVREEPDGAIIGIEFTGASANLASVPPPPPGSQRIPSFAQTTPPDDEE